MKKLILLLTISIFFSCGAEVTIYTQTTVKIKNESSYTVGTVHNPVERIEAGAYPFQSLHLDGKRVYLSTYILEPGEEKVLLGLGSFNAPAVATEGLGDFSYVLNLRFEKEDLCYFFELYLREKDVKIGSTLVFTLTDDLISKMVESEKYPFEGDIKEVGDRVSGLLYTCWKFNDKTKAEDKEVPLGRVYPYWDIWNVKEDYPNDWRLEALKLNNDESNISGYSYENGELKSNLGRWIGKSLYILNDEVLYEIDLETGKRKKIRAMTEEEKQTIIEKNQSNVFPNLM